MTKFDTSVGQAIKKPVVIATLVIFAIVSWFLIATQWKAEYRNHEKEATKQIESVALSLSGMEIVQLSGVPEDEQTEAFQSIKLRLQAHLALNTNISYLYIFRIDNNSIVFMVDAEDPLSSQYSPPGQVYTETSPERLLAYTQNLSVFEPKYTDSYGTWVSVVAQINNLQTGETIAYLGVDYDARTFYSAATVLAAEHAVLIAAIYFIIISIVLAIINNVRLRKKQREFDLLFHQTPIGIALHQIVCDEAGKPIDYVFLSVNKSFETMLGIAAKDVIGKSVLQLFPATESHWIDTYGKVALTQKPITYFDFSAQFQRDYKVVAYSPQKYQFAVLVEDITDAKAMEQKIMATAKEYETMANSLLVGLMVINKQGNIEYANKKACSILGVTYDELVALYSTKQKWSLLNAEGRPLNKEEYPFNVVLKTQKSVENQIAGVKTKKRDIVWLSINAVPFSVQGGEVEKMIINISDITQERMKQKEIEYISEHDALTGLYNRRFYEATLPKLDKAKHFPITVVFIDVNSLKLFNDAYGHDVGDEVLVSLAEALQQSMFPKDIVCRTGGDEFSVIMPSTTNAQAQDRIHLLQQTLKLHRVHNIPISVSVGFETKTSTLISIKDVQRTAEKMMYQQKVSTSLQVRSQAIQTIFKTLTEKTNYEKEHSQHVALLCAVMGNCLGLTSFEIQQLELAGKYHDIGKISIPASILFKPSKLTTSEYEIMKSHPEVGYQILRAADEFSSIAEYVLYHHEWWDGSGYTKGLKGTEIPYFSRIISICDAYEAMVTNRPYRNGIGRENAVQELCAYAGKQFDPQLVTVFIEQVLPQIPF